MPFHPIANTVKVVLRGDLNGQQTINTFFYKQAGTLPITIADIDDLLSDFYVNVVPGIQGCVNTAWRGIELTGRDMTSSTGATSAFPLSGSPVGLRTGAVAPGNVSIGVRRRAGQPGRRYRGRIELPAITEGDLDGDTIITTLRNAILNLIVKLLLDFTTSSGKIMQPAVGSSANGTSSLITAWLFDLISDSQKTRLTAHGS